MRRKLEKLWFAVDHRLLQKWEAMNRPRTEPEDFADLYRRAFVEYGTQALWNKRFIEEPTPDDALVIARALRIEGDAKPGSWPSRSRKPAVPLSKIQIDILRLLAARTGTRKATLPEPVR